MTAVEYLAINIEPFKYKRNDEIMRIIEIIESARQIEAKQIKDAFYYGGIDFQEQLNINNAEVPYYNEAEKYYLETYKNKKK